MIDEMTIEVEGLREAQAKMEQVVKDLYGQPALMAMRESVLLLQRDAKINAPVDTGRLRASIMPEVRTHSDVIEGVVGSNVIYAPYMEFGTGVFTGPEESFAGAFAMAPHTGAGRHWPPSEALSDWARRHGIPSGYLVARAIGMRGGLRPRRYLQRALESNRDRIKRIWENTVGRIVMK